MSADIEKPAAATTAKEGKPAAATTAAVAGRQRMTPEDVQRLGLDPSCYGYKPS